MKINNKGFVIYYFLIIFFLINLTAGGIMNEFLKSVKDENLHLNKENSRILAESGFEIAISKVYKKDSQGTYFIKEDIGEMTIKIEEYSEDKFIIESLGIFKDSKTRVEGKLELKKGLYPEIMERKMW